MEPRRRSTRQQRIGRFAATATATPPVFRLAGDGLTVVAVSRADLDRLAARRAVAPVPTFDEADRADVRLDDVDRGGAVR